MSKFSQPKNLVGTQPLAGETPRGHCVKTLLGAAAIRQRRVRSNHVIRVSVGPMASEIIRPKSLTSQEALRVQFGLKPAELAQ
jgi:hypothetical protein